MLFFGSKKVVAIDIGTSSIKIAELDVGRTSSKLLSFSVMPTPKDSYLNGDVLNAGSISNVISEMKTALKIKRKSASVGLSGSSVVVKKINIPKMEESLVAEQIKWEAEQYIPYDINEVNVDYHVLDNAESSDVMTIMLVAAVQDAVFKSAEVVSLAGFNCTHIDVDSFALGNCFLQNYEPQGVNAILCIGSTVSHLVFVENNEIVFTRDIAMGGASYSNELQKGMGITFQEAEDLKISASSDAPVPEQVKEIIHGCHDLLLEDIFTAIDQYLDSTSSQLNSLYLTGGGSRTYSLRSKINERYTVEDFNPFTKLRVKSKNLTEEYLAQVSDIASVVVGLGLRKIGDVK